MRTGARAGAALAVLAVVVGCSPGAQGAPGSSPPAASAAPTSAATTTAPDPADPAGPPSPDAVRAGGQPIGGEPAGALLATARAGVTVEPSADGAATWTVPGEDVPGEHVTGAGVPGSGAAAAWVAPPAGGSAEVLTDGSAVLRDADGRVVAALAVVTRGDGTRGAWRTDAGLLALADPGSVTVGVDALASATWGEAEGGRSLAVVPADWVRGGSLAAQEALASQLEAREPEAASASMRAQLWCHVLGAQDKASWNLEPWRPEVGTATLVLTRCNPTDDDL